LRNFAADARRKCGTFIPYFLSKMHTTGDFFISFFPQGGSMKVLSVSFIALLILVSVSLQAQTKKEAPKMMKGYLIDKMCGSTMAKKSADEAMASVAKHTRQCATEEGCAESGYGLMMNGKWTAFDNAGNKKAAEYLKTTKAVDHLYVVVSGTQTKDNIAVASIKEAKEKKQ
jgi:hypothetical protein